MFDKIKFAQILKNINETYDSQRDFSKKSEINRTYLSQYMNMKLEEPPKPKILEKLANFSNGITTYEELMEICGYINISKISKDTYSRFNITEYEWTLIFGNRDIINLNTNEAIIWSEITNNLYTDNGDVVYNIDNYIKKCKNNDEKNTITQLYYFFLLLLTKFINNKKEYDDLISEIEEMKLSQIINNDRNSTNKYFMTPVYGSISAGQPNWAEECIEGRIPIDPELMGIINPEEHFFLRVNGESMNKVIKNGAFALIHKQDDIENGEIAVVLVNGYDATLKKFTKQGELIILEPQSDDESFKTQVYDKTTPIRIIGKYVGKMEINK